MLKAYAIEDLRAGMVIGRDVVDSDAGVLVGKGSVLTNQMIYSLLERPIFSVYVDESEEEETAIPGKEHLVDRTYAGCYDLVYHRVSHLFMTLDETGQLDLVELQSIVDEEIFPKLCDGATAVSQIHNMPREGNYLIHHCLHVAILAGLMGKWLSDWSELKQRELVLAGLIHDIGKLRVSQEILNKNGELTAEEFREIQKHTEHGYNMLKLGTLGKNRQILFAVLQHHERCDGSGYPNGVLREQISDYGRIIALLDIYDAMAADRVYAKRRSPFDVFAILYEDILRGKLDTEYGVYFLKHLCHALNGNWVRLSDGSKGKIVYIDESRVTSLPVVQITEDKFIDLNQNTSVKIEALLTANELG